MQPQLANNVQQATSPWFAQIRKLVESATSLEQIRDGLEQLIPGMTLDQYAQAMAEALAAAQLAGRTEVLAGSWSREWLMRLMGPALQEQAEFFRRKLNLPTTSWTDIYTQEHDWAFVVAGANRDAIVSTSARRWTRPSLAAPRWKTSARTLTASWPSTAGTTTAAATGAARSSTKPTSTPALLLAAGSSCSTRRTGNTSTATG
jgi:hypothetical protein